MRINVYSEEITERVELVRKSAEGRDFIGLRFYLLTAPEMLPPMHPDDDSSAVTLWFDDPSKLRMLVRSCLNLSDEAERYLHVGRYD